ncbi:hypothetical protein TgHK011_009673 [Trichoderma gracile]|nr:hypothetical protein TgHK011_009673 [Trichoderma gracile]
MTLLKGGPGSAFIPSACSGRNCWENTSATCMALNRRHEDKGAPRARPATCYTRDRAAKLSPSPGLFPPRQLDAKDASGGRDKRRGRLLVQHPKVPLRS